MVVVAEDEAVCILLVDAEVSFMISLEAFSLDPTTTGAEVDVVAGVV